MSLLKRFRDIMASNMNAAIDKAEDPEKMLNQYLRELRSQLGTAKAEAATMMATEQRARRQLDECLAEINKFERYAVRSLEMGNEADARQFLDRKAQVAVKEAELKQVYEQAAANAKKLREIHEKFQSDIQELETRQIELKGKLSAAKVQQKINRGSELEEKAERTLFEAEALAELNSPDNELDRLLEEYTQKDSSSVDNELEALKKKLNGK
ncbi:PspA/IM30 family protein [Anaerobacillus alkaliphilus]|uniref:PspA/IM30 family protein n=1 Tax=Anaerobacillus alkaliphilus TaxID=1548597 RepID=A0A4Q0VSV1_9BACI|nr:PspA/IM30 family protein [Anaerobacillus alkaliphilus]RXJ01632.1 PspA/IM30 family protein [Anaerobacillus alkaliphilus]